MISKCSTSFRCVDCNTFWIFLFLVSSFSLQVSYGSCMFNIFWYPMQSKCHLHNSIQWHLYSSMKGKPLTHIWLLSCEGRLHKTFLLSVSQKSELFGGSCQSSAPCWGWIMPFIQLYHHQLSHFPWFPPLLMFGCPESGSRNRWLQTKISHLRVLNLKACKTTFNSKHFLKFLYTSPKLSWIRYFTDLHAHSFI